MQKLAEICIRRPVFAAMIVLALVVVGAACYFRLGRRPLPLRRPADRLRAHGLPGASTEEIETEVSQQIEEAVNTVQGIQELRSVSRPGNSFVIVTFELEPRHRHRRPGRPRPRRERSCATCRDDIQPPVISKFDNDSAPVMTDRALRQPLAARADRARRQGGQGRSSSARPASARCSIVGGLERAINVWIDRRPAGRLPDPDHRGARRHRAPERRRAGRQRHRRRARA